MDLRVRQCRRRSAGHRPQLAGAAVGVADARKLLVDLPNKIRDVLGVMADVNSLKNSGKELIEICVESYPTPISYKGSYYYRSGSTTQELKGAALERFLNRRQGHTWDGRRGPACMHDLSKPAIDAFRKAARRSGRVETAVFAGVGGRADRKAAPDRRAF